MMSIRKRPNTFVVAWGGCRLIFGSFWGGVSLPYLFIRTAARHSPVVERMMLAAVVKAVVELNRQTLE